MIEKPDLFKNDFKFLVGYKDYIADEGPSGVRSDIQLYVKASNDKSLDVNSIFEEVKPLMINAPFFAPSANIGKDKNYQIEENSILIPDPYIHFHGKNWLDA